MSLNETFITRSLQGLDVSLSRQQMLLKKRISVWILEFSRLAILIPEHVAFKPEIVRLKPFPDKWLFTDRFFTLYSLRNEGPVFPLFPYRTIIVHTEFYHRVVQFIEEWILRDQG